MPPRSAILNTHVSEVVGASVNPAACAAGPASPVIAPRRVTESAVLYLQPTNGHGSSMPNLTGAPSIGHASQSAYVRGRACSWSCGKRSSKGQLSSGRISRLLIYATIYTTSTAWVALVSGTRVVVRATAGRLVDRILYTAVGLFASYAHFSDERDNSTAGTVYGSSVVGICPVTGQLMEYSAGYYPVFDLACLGGAPTYSQRAIRRWRDPTWISDIDRR